jgi:hypothetical protein
MARLHRMSASELLRRWIRDHDEQMVYYAEREAQERAAPMN